MTLIIKLLHPYLLGVMGKNVIGTINNYIITPLHPRFKKLSIIDVERLWEVLVHV